ncbi:MAG TPA: chemotaxis protein CheA [Ignavibacteriaceae bacterium]|nr:chemotaxis protein CheA [Ignavibacteriaceae bacterium]HRP91998.1 chemotaxis protein CheA [Ignavibacteriaceae bacterium]HRQ54596.1 chemotaxis protein CheA [Ignavibacteriaceae bacterium]
MAKSNQNPILIDPDMKEIVESFIIETKEILEKLDADLVEMEKRPDDNELLNSVFRHFHTIKGTSSFLGLDKLTGVTHKGEDILNKLRKLEVSLSASIMDALLLAYDKMKSLLYSIEEFQNEDIDVDDTIKELTDLISTLENGGVVVEKKKPVKKSKKKYAKSELNIDTNNTTETVVMSGSTEDKILEETEDADGEHELPQVENKIVAVDKSKQDTTKKVENSIRVDVERLDELLNIVSELVLGRNRLAQVNSEFALENEGTKFSRDLFDVTKQIDLMTNELQLVVMKTRMIKIGKVFNKFPRLVRDLSRDAKKQINIVVKGEETELDKTLIEEINDPLVHLVRNSVDHGIENPETRKANGKNPAGTLTLSAAHEGNNIIITIEDDGKGIDPEVIKAKVLQKGLISAERAKELTRQEILNLIFLPGFSTAEVVTNISGRGVGMDVVKTNVTKLRGIINIESNVGVGTKIIIKLPLTLAIISGMIVKVKDEQIVIPLNTVLEVLRVHRENIYSVNQRPVIKMRASVLPLVSVEEVLFGAEEKDENRIWQYVVVVGIAEKRYGIKVDSLVGQKEVVIKSLGNYFGKVQGIAGSTIMGDGSVVMIVDVNELLHKAEKLT